VAFRRAPKLSTWRKVALVSWGAPNNPTAYGSLDLECDRALAYIDALRAKTGERVTLTHLVGKAAAMALASAPEVNGFASFGRLMLRETVDVFFQVAFFDERADAAAGTEKAKSTRSDANLAGAKVRSADTKSVAEIARELRERAGALRERGDAPTAKVARKMSRVPGPIIQLATSAAAFLSYDLGLDLSALGMPTDPFGSCMVTNIGSFGIREGHAPLIPYARVPVILTVGAVRDAPAIHEGRVVVRKVVTIGVAFDHRVFDGYHAGVMGRIFTTAFADPETAFGVSAT
jgi:pyruvate dehydrogenase E2 component (dihydrolipoamide acetyltransferase)